MTVLLLTYNRWRAPQHALGSEPVLIRNSNVKSPWSTQRPKQL